MDGGCVVLGGLVGLLGCGLVVYLCGLVFVFGVVGECVVDGLWFGLSAGPCGGSVGEGAV